MASGFGGIIRNGSSPNYSYGAIAGRENMPVNYVTFWDATRFANWLHNGQPTGVQDGSTTEDGAYTLTPAGIAANSVMRNAGAMVFIPSEDEWYKAAYYKGGGTSAGYWDYPAVSDSQTKCRALPETESNWANCNDAEGDLTDVGSYTGSASPSGTFDQGGNVFEHNDTIIDGSYRGWRGGSFSDFPALLKSSWRWYFWPDSGDFNTGIRVASLPEPDAVVLQLAVLLSLMGCRKLLAQSS